MLFPVVPTVITLENAKTTLARIAAALEADDGMVMDAGNPIGTLSSTMQYADEIRHMLAHPDLLTTPFDIRPFVTMLLQCVHFAIPAILASRRHVRSTRNLNPNYVRTSNGVPVYE